MQIESYNFSYAQKLKKRKTIFLVITSFIGVLVLLQVILSFIIYPVRVTSTSMEPELSQSNALFVSPLMNGNTLFSNDTFLTRGTLVTMDNKTVLEKNTVQKIIDFILGVITVQKYRPFESTRWGDMDIYRIVGLPGDTIYIDNYVAYIREGGSSHFLTEFELSEIEYDIISNEYPENWNMSIGAQGKTKQISLRHDEYFLLSDNRIIATDSRIFGSVPIENINGKVLIRYYPISAIRAY